VGSHHEFSNASSHGYPFHTGYPLGKPRVPKGDSFGFWGPNDTGDTGSIPGKPGSPGDVFIVFLSFPGFLSLTSPLLSRMFLQVRPEVASTPSIPTPAPPPATHTPSHPHPLRASPPPTHPHTHPPTHPPLQKQIKQKTKGRHRVSAFRTDIRLTTINLATPLWTAAVL